MRKGSLPKALALIALATVPFMAKAWRVVIDPNCVKAVTANTATQKLIEEGHNKRLDSIAARKRRLELYHVSMATIKELYKVTMQNVRGFGPESRYYIEIGRCAAEIVTDVPDLVRTVSRAKFRNKILCLNELAGLVTETRSLVADFVNIVNNGQVANPLKAGDAAQGDGYNFLDRHERLTVANSVYTRLREIRYRVEGMRAMAQYATLNDLFFSIAPDSWANLVTMRNQVNVLVADWNGLIMHRV